MHYKLSFRLLEDQSCDQLGRWRSLPDDQNAGDPTNNGLARTTFGRGLPCNLDAALAADLITRLIFKNQEEKVTNYTDTCLNFSMAGETCPQNPHLVLPSTGQKLSRSPTVHLSSNPRNTMHFQSGQCWDTWFAFKGVGKSLQGDPLMLPRHETTANIGSTFKTREITCQCCASCIAPSQ